MDHVTELLLYNAARVQHIKEVIAPSLARGEIVITDRFSDSTLAYQGYGRGIDRQVIDALDAVSTGCMRPDLTVLLDVDVETGLRRNKEMNKNDRLELEDIAFHQGYGGASMRSRLRSQNGFASFPAPTASKRFTGPYVIPLSRS